MFDLSPDSTARFNKDGYLILPEVFERQEVQEWKRKLEDRVQNERDRPDNHNNGVRVYFCDELDPITSSNVANTRLLEVLKHVIGPEIEFLSVKSVFKNSITSFPSPWHQDWHYWHGTTKTSVWIALDDATEDNGCLKLVPGSHKRVIEMEKINDDKGFTYRISDNALDVRNAVTAPIEAGGVIIFHDLLLHASCPNLNGNDRWSAIATYRDASQKDESTVWRDSKVVRTQKGP